MKLLATFKNTRDEVEGRIYEKNEGGYLVAELSSADFSLKSSQEFGKAQIEWAYMCAKRFAKFVQIGV